MKITLCGSTKFGGAYRAWNLILTLCGHIVYSVAGFGHEDDVFTEEEKRRLDLIHLEKIAQSDVIVILNVGGYIGDSTRREIEYARMLGRDIYFLETSDGNRFLGQSIWRLPHLFEDGSGGFINVSHEPRARKLLEEKHAVRTTPVEG